MLELLETRRLRLVLTALLHLAASRQPTPGKQLAERLRCSRRYLEPDLQALSQAGILESRRGAHGGYRLARCGGASAERPPPVGGPARAPAGGAGPADPIRGGRGDLMRPAVGHPHQDTGPRADGRPGGSRSMSRWAAASAASAADRSSQGRGPSAYRIVRS